MKSKNLALLLVCGLFLAACGPSATAEPTPDAESAAAEPPEAGTAPAAPEATPTPVPDDLHWYKDAVVYQLHIKAFFDSNGDGLGDFRGLTEKLDYVRDLGVNTIWLLPF